MTVRSDIEGIRTRQDLSLSEKLFAVRTIKTAAFRALALSEFNLQIGQLNITVSQINITTTGFECNIVVVRNSNTILSDHFVFVNPPIMIRDPAGDIDLGDGVMARENPLAAIRQVIGDAVVSRLKQDNK